ncbi:hypothetical protein J7K99_04985, partial [bacterium]|nr:hypothetical protein [bacterium]
MKYVNIIFVLVAAFSLSFSQDSLHIRRRGSWACPTDDLSGYGIIMHRILDHYIVVGRGNGTGFCGDSLWFLDISDPDSPYVVRIYADTVPEGDSIGYIRWFQVCKDSGYIYAGYGRMGMHGGEYIRVLKVEEKGDTLSVEKRFFVDSVLFTSAGLSGTVQDSFVLGSGIWLSRCSDTLVPVSRYAVSVNPTIPPDGNPSYWFSLTESYLGDSFAVDCGGVASLYPDSLEPSAILGLMKHKFYIFGDEIVDTIWRLGCWRTEYDGELGQAVAISESLGVVMLGTRGGEHPGLYFIRLSDIEAGDYTAEPITKLNGNIIDLYVKDDTLVYFQGFAGLYIFDISDLPSIDTVGFYRSGSDGVIIVEGRYVYRLNTWGVFTIFEVDSTLGIQGKLERGDKLEIYPNPIVFGSRLCLRGLDEVRG